MSLKSGLETTIIERTGELLHSQYKNNQLFVTMECNIQRYKKTLKAMLNEEQNTALKMLLRELNLKTNVEGQFLYCQGLRDGTSIFAYLENEFTDKCFYKRNIEPNAKTYDEDDG